MKVKSLRPLRKTAHAKINLALHVIGRRQDNYHLLDSLVAFTQQGDELTFSLAETTGLEITGPFAKGLAADDSNLIVKALHLLGRIGERELPPVNIHLIKNLPVASGIGGGSADAACALAGLNELFDLGLTHSQLAELGLQLGADVPVCLTGQTCQMQGIGENLLPVRRFPSQPIVLVNPGIAVSTAQIFAQLAMPQGNDPARALPKLPCQEINASGENPVTENASEMMEVWLDWLSQTRNDLQEAAIAQAPEISQVLDQLRRLPGCRLARMSGSGATCFGLFETASAAIAAREKLARDFPHWWTAESGLISP